MATAASPMTLPRGLIFMASIWLIGSWVLTIGVSTPIQPVSASYTPAVRMMLVSMVVGLMIAWPLLRLSQGRSDRPVGYTVLDLVVLVALTQVVVWPLRLVTPWTVERTAAIDATITSWVVLVAAIVAVALAAVSAGVRGIAMAVCLALCIAGPALATIAPLGGIAAADLATLSPLMAVRELSGGGGSPVTDEQWLATVTVGAAGVLAWLVIGVVATTRRRSTP